MQRVRQQGVQVNTWTVNAPALLERLWRWGVGMVYSDVPERLVGTW